MPEVKMYNPMTGEPYRQHVPRKCNACGNDVDTYEGYKACAYYHAPKWNYKWGPQPFSKIDKQNETR